MAFMSDLTDFLQARIAEDEATTQFVIANTDRDEQPAELVGSPYDPLRVLAECAAKRRIVEIHRAEEGMQPPICRECSYDGDDETRWVDMPCPTLKALALTYSDHAGYREEWRPADMLGLLENTAIGPCEKCGQVTRGGLEHQRSCPGWLTRAKPTRGIR
jgi:predicted Zn-ribbon and HTH transcriptional regulator